MPEKFKLECQRSVMRLTYKCTCVWYMMYLECLEMRQTRCTMEGVELYSSWETSWESAQEFRWLCDKRCVKFCIEITIIYGALASTRYGKERVVCKLTDKPRLISIDLSRIRFEHRWLLSILILIDWNMFGKIQCVQAWEVQSFKDSISESSLESD